MIDAKTIVSAVKNSDALLVDVRSKAEYKIGHAQKAINVPLDRLDELKEPDKNKPIFLYCASGMRSGHAAMVLQQRGYKKITNLGGISAWQRIGGKITS